MAQTVNVRNTVTSHQIVNSNAIAALRMKDGIKDEAAYGSVQHRPLAPKALAGLHGHHPKHNGLLAALPEADYARLDGRLAEVRKMLTSLTMKVKPISAAS